MVLGTALIITSFRSGQTPRASDQPANIATVNADVSTAAPDSSARHTFEKFPATSAPDADHDGLPDAEEQGVGTDQAKTDTDGDGLSDYDEVKIYHTNPKLKDTDTDGTGDSQEVTANTNPLGTGPLQNIDQAIQQLQKK